MYRRQCLFALLTLTSYFVKAWDVAVNTDDKIKFYWNRPDVLIHYRDLSALAYDAVNNTMFLVAREEEHAIVISYNLDTKYYQTLVEDKIYKNIPGIAYDPVESQLFWIDFDKKSIFKRSLTFGNQEHHLLFKMDHELPQAIAVDSCRGYIYWTNTNITRPTIERARFDGSEREIVIKNDVYRAYSIVVDQQTQKLYWVDKREGIHYSIESSDLDGNNRKQLLYKTHQTPNAITVSKDSVFWVDSEQRKVWKLAKANSKPKLEEFVSFGNEMVFGIVANYDIKDQTVGVPQCENLAQLAQNKANKSSILQLPNQTRNVVGSSCVCPKKECEISVCQNYCVQGDCSINSEGQPQCSCENGFTGSRCEVNICNNYCLNDGKCSLDDANKPSCSCVNGHEGERCEVVQTVIAAAVATNKNEHCNCSNVESWKTSSALVDENNVGCGGEWDPIRDPIVITLGCICGLLSLACAVLFTKILDLKRRPRIKKRIIVNKNVTPLTARPDQCEITIENCCNMNICETPCFEPKTTIKPTLLDAKPGKEEKKNLIDNMEHPDDLY